MAFLYFTPLLLPWCACSSRAMISHVVRLMEQVSTIFEFAKTKIYCTTWLAAILSYDVNGRVECKKSLVWCSVGIIYCWFPARNWFHFHLLSNTRTFWNRWSKMNSFQIELERLRIFGQCRAWGNTDTLLSGIGQLYVPMNTIMQLQPEILKYTAQLHGLHLLLLITKNAQFSIPLCLQSARDLRSCTHITCIVQCV